MDTSERRTIVEQHISLIVCLAKKLAVYFHGQVPLEELISFGAEGAMKAMQLYDPSKGKAVSWMYPRIRGGMLDGVRAEKEGRRIREKRRIIQDIREQLTQALGRPPLEDEIDQAIKEQGHRRYCLPKFSFRPMHRYVNLAKGCEDHKAVKPDELVADEDRFSCLLRGLDKRDQTIAEMRIRDDQSMTAIGEVIGLTESGTTKRWQQIRAVLRTRMEVAA